jgi:hypothetical protein
MHLVEVPPDLLELDDRSRDVQDGPREPIDVAALPVRPVGESRERDGARWKRIVMEENTVIASGPTSQTDEVDYASCLTKGIRAAQATMPLKQLGSRGKSGSTLDRRRWAAVELNMAVY